MIESIVSKVVAVAGMVLLAALNIWMKHNDHK